MNHTSSLKDGTLIAGIYILLLIAVLAVPIVNVLFLWALPLPLAYFAARHKLKHSILLYVLLCLISWPIHMYGLILTFIFAMVGVVIGELHRRKADGFTVLRGVSLAFVFHLTAAYVAFSLLSDVTIRQLIRTQGEQVRSMLESAGQSSEQIDIVLESMNMVSYLVPFMIVSVAVVMALLIMWLTGILFRRCEIEAQRLPAFRNWSFPKAFIWIYLLAFVLLLSNPEEGSTLFIAISNVFLLVETVMTIQGFTFILFFFHHKKYPKALGIMVVILGILIAPLQQIIRLVGIADLVLDLKSRLGSQRK